VIVAEVSDPDLIAEVDEADRNGARESDALVLVQVRSDVLSGRAREIRERSGLSQAELAAAIDVPRSTLTLWETKQRRPHGAAAIRYGRFLDTLASDRDGLADQPIPTFKIRREQAGHSQSELARQMKQRGFNWHQATVNRTESGERPLRVDEALTLATIIGLPLPGNDPELSDELTTARRRIADQDELIADLKKGAEWRAARISYLEGVVHAVQVALNSGEST